MTADLDRYACDARFPGLQTVRLMRRAIESTRLDLKGLRVLTEASVGYRRITPVLAALAGADEVYAVGRDSAAASRKEAEEQTAYFAELARVGTRVKLLSTRLQAPLDAVDVVTDLPGVRPVDESIIRNVAETAAVSLMRSVAHWRAADVDVATCRRHGVAVAGLDEEAVGLLRYAPQAVLAGLLDLGVEVAGSTIVVAGDGPAVPYVVQALARLGARVLVAAPETAGRIGLYGGEKAGDALGDDAVAGRLAEADALVLCPADTDARTVGPGAPVGRGAPRGGRAAPRRGRPGRRERPSGARRRRPPLPARRRPRRGLRPAAAGGRRPARRRPQGRRGDDAGAAARLVAARRRAAGRRRSARRAAAQGPLGRRRAGSATGRWPTGGSPAAGVAAAYAPSGGRPRGRMVESGRPRQPAAGGRPRGRPRPPAPEAPRTHSPADAWPRRKGRAATATRCCSRTP